MAKRGRLLRLRNAQNRLDWRISSSARELPSAQRAYDKVFERRSTLSARSHTKKYKIGAKAFRRLFD